MSDEVGDRKETDLAPQEGVGGLFVRGIEDARERTSDPRGVPRETERPECDFIGGFERQPRGVERIPGG